MFLLLTFDSVHLALASDEYQNQLISDIASYKIGDKKDEEATFDPDAEPPLSFIVTKQLSFGAKLNVKTDIKDNEDLNDEETDDLTSLDSDLSLAMLYTPFKNVELYVEGKGFYETPLEDSQNQQDWESGIDLKRGYLLWRNFLVPSLEVQIGRQRFKDKREWFIDKNLDALRILYEKGPFAIGFSASTNVIDPAEPEDRILNYMLKTRYYYGKKSKITLYGLLRRDNSDENFSPSYIGLALRDRSFKRQKLWLDFAFLLGHEEDKRLRGFGLDARWTSKFKFPMKPSITLGFAFGSGDSDPDTDVDRNFRQTGLHDNNGKFNGNTKFKYYGEVFDPELANMMIWTAGVGIKPLKKTSLDLIYHYYYQVEKSDDLRDVDIDPDPSGEDRDLGHAVDFILGKKLKKDVRVSLTGGVFFPGDAFPKDEDDISLFGELKIEIAF